MAVYFLTNTSSGVGTTLLMHSLQNVTTTRVISLGSLGTTTIDFITPSFYPNNNNVTTTTSQLIITHTVTNGSITVTPTLIRVNSAGVTQATGTAGTPTTTAATNTFNTLDDPTWSTVCGDRIILRLVYINTAMATRSCTLGLDRVGTYLNSTIPLNTRPGCQVLRKIVRVI